MQKTKIQKTNFLLYSSGDEQVFVEVYFKDENIWLTQKLMSQLFDVGIPAINKHLRNVFKSGELKEKSVVSILEITANDGKIYKTKFYNLDAIISVGYRVNSLKATKFRIWATKKLKEFIIKGFVLDDERLKGIGGGNYWKELLDRIRDIRSSEKVLYRQVLDLYATSIDYNSKSEESKKFFATVQNKLHYAVNKKTAAELIYDRANAEKEFMGLVTFSGEIPIKKDIAIAKNYLKEQELQRLNRLVSAFFDLAELKAMEHQAMKMQDWIHELDTFTTSYGKGTLQNAGKISHNKAIDKAEREYKKYQVKTFSPVEKDYLESVKNLEKNVLKKTKK